MRLVDPNWTAKGINEGDSSFESTMSQEPTNLPLEFYGYKKPCQILEHGDEKTYRIVRHALFGRFILSRLRHRRFIRMLNHCRNNTGAFKPMLTIP